MSFVLDALKVSEQRRSRFSRRIYAHPPRPRRAGRRKNWLMALGVALGVPAAIALVVLGWRLVALAPGPLSLPAPAQASGAAPSGAPPAKSPGTASTPMPAVEDKNMFDDPGPATRATGPELQQDSSGQRTAPASAGPGGGAQVSVPQPDSTQDVLAAAPPDWPILSLQMLFFSEEQNRSFVQVNGRTYRQGEQLAAGPQVLRIARDGVTLAYRGERVLLGVEQ